MRCQPENPNLLRGVRALVAECFRGVIHHLFRDGYIIDINIGESVRKSAKTFLTHVGRWESPISENQSIKFVPV